MTEQELMEKIKRSAGDVEIPDSLSPDAVKQRLMQRAGLSEDREDSGNRKKGMGVLPEENGAASWSTKEDRQDMRGKSGEERRQKKRGWKRYAGRYAAAAAVAVLGIAGLSGVYYSQKSKPDITAEGGRAESEDNGDTAEDRTVADMDAGRPEESMTEQETVRTAKRDAGDLYTTASDYGEVYDVLEDMEWNVYREDLKLEAAEEEGISDMDAGTSGMTDISYSAQTDSSPGLVRSEASAVKESAAEDTDGNYSKTNLQTEGVDESDIVKTDGSFLYIAKEESVEIVDVREKEMKRAGTITLAMGSAADCVREMYVDKNTLNLIIEKEESRLNKETSGMKTKDSGTEQEEAEEDLEADVYSLDSKVSTELLTYDISDRKNPVLKGKVTQDGGYDTSRKIGDIIYLFTEKGVERPKLTREEASMEENAGGWIPLVNGKAVAADCIYIPEEGNRGLIVASVDVKKPDRIVDNTLIINRAVEVYVSMGALYLYGQDYSGSGVTTQIAKFKLDKGIIDAVGAVSAAGAVTDTFAIHEYQGKLRLLTTDWSSAESRNYLYLFDQNLNRTGTLSDIAPGEEIYAARYIKNMAYFVTYRNTDPLFVVDLSDEKNPKVLSELKITGFSEYLHFWGEDKLLGIGYETDPDTGTREGIKLTMFDISEPADLKTAGTCVIENLDYSPALYDYKCVLADAGENIIGFAGQSYGGKENFSYLIFSWENGAFCEKMTESLADRTDLSEYRGIYIGDTFYLAGRNSVTSYDRKNGYKMLQSMEI